MTIETQVLYTPVPARTPWQWKAAIYGFASVWGLGLSDVAVVGIMLGCALAALIHLFGLPLIHRLAVGKIVEKVGPEVETAFMKFIGKKPLYCTVEPASRNNVIAGTGIAYDGEHIFMMDMGVGAKIPWDDIRSWRWETQDSDKIVVLGGGLTDGGARMSAAMHNNEVRSRDYQASGFFVQVADVNRPEWQYTTTNESVLKRWAEIFTQIKEGRIAQPASA